MQRGKAKSWGKDSITHPMTVSIETEEFASKCTRTTHTLLIQTIPPNQTSIPGIVQKTLTVQEKHLGTVLKLIMPALHP